MLLRKLHTTLLLKLPAVLFSGLLVATGSGRAQTSESATDPSVDMKQMVDAVMQPFLSKEQAPGAIVGISSHGKRSYFTYGLATDDGAHFIPTTLVEIGSCTKVFTSTMFAMAINQGQMNPDGSIQMYMPNGLRLQAAAQQVTPRELANHTSGMPDDPPGLPRQLEMRSIEFYTSKDFLHWVSKWSPDGVLPAPYVYSNAASGLLGYLVADATHTPWEQLLSQQITGPLSMVDTEINPNSSQMQRMAMGHRKNGTPAPAWPVYAWYPAGALRSTAADMLSFGEANLGHGNVAGQAVSRDLIAAMKLAQTPTFDLPNGRERQGMAWATNIGEPGSAAEPEVLKNRGTGGFSTVILMNPSKDLTIFIAVNKQGAHPAQIAVPLGRQLQ